MSNLKTIGNIKKNKKTISEQRKGAISSKKNNLKGSRREMTTLYIFRFYFEQSIALLYLRKTPMNESIFNSNKFYIQEL